MFLLAAACSLIFIIASVRTVGFRQLLTGVMPSDKDIARYKSEMARLRRHAYWSGYLAVAGFFLFMIAAIGKAAHGPG